jgi:hypothetical protein
MHSLTVQQVQRWVAGVTTSPAEGLRRSKVKHTCSGCNGPWGSSRVVVWSLWGLRHRCRGEHPTSNASRYVVTEVDVREPSLAWRRGATGCSMSPANAPARLDRSSSRWRRGRRVGHSRRRRWSDSHASRISKRVIKPFSILKM